MFSVPISVVVLVIAGALICQLLFKDPISRQKRSIEETESPEAKAGLIRKSQTENEFVVSSLEKMLASIKAAFGGQEPVTDYDRHHKAQIIWRLVVVGILLDWLIQWLVNQRMPVLSPLAWGVPSLIVALLITWFVELAAFSLTHDPARQARGERICRDAMIVTGIVSVAGMLLFLFGRTVSAASATEWLIAVISGSMWIVAEGLGVSCGFAAAWARHVDRAGLASRESDRIKQQLQPRYAFREWLKEQGIKSKVKIASAALLLFMALVPADSSFGQPPRPDLTILIDGAQSVDQIRMGEALEKLRESAPIIAKTCGRVKIVIFSDEEPFTKVSTVVSIPPLAVVKDCSGPAAGKILRQDFTMLLPEIKEYQDIQSTRQCRATNLSVEQKNRENLASATGKIRAAIPESVQPKPGCTAIVSLLQFVLSSRSTPTSTIFLITDGEETCSDAIPKFQVPSGAKLALFMVPKKGQIEKEGPEALKRGEMWQTSIPDLTAKPYTQIRDYCE